jgi:4-hydroxy-2-oxoglutarate aldolase
VSAPALSLGGVLGPVVTPFSPDTSTLDLDAFARNARAHVAAGLDGLLVCGSTGEAALLDESERDALVETARDVLPADRLLLVGTGAESTQGCVRRCRQAAARGAHAALVVSPHYYTSAMTPAALEAHFTRVADESPIPVLLYNIPKYAHLVLEPDLVERLSQHANIAGMKDSAGDVERLRGYVRSQGEHFAVLTGHAGTFSQAAAMGVRGGILAVALFAPAASRAVWDASLGGHVDEAEAAQRVLVPLGAEIVAKLGVAGVKHAMDVIGCDGGPVRSPLLPLSAQEHGRVLELLDAAGVTVAA